jgi:enoyl-CoA hydratase/carnithine racemase
MELATVKYERDGHVVTITLNRPDALNAMNVQLRDDVDRAWEAFKADEDAWVAILTGAGERALCAGMDVKEEARTGNMNRPPEEEVRRRNFSPRQAGVQKPVICALNGIVGGVGLVLVSDADIVIAAEHAEIFNPGVSVGIVAPFGPIAMARNAPFGPIMRMFLVGNKERISAQRAYELGLVTEVVPKEDLLPAARRLAAKIAENAPTAVRLAKQCLWDALDLTLSGALENSTRIMDSYRGHPDLAEGPRAFAEKRKPVWTVR